jgi:hypothetical protein
VGLKLIFLIVSRTMSLLRLSRRESWWKDAEILMLRHQFSIALREQPRAHSRLTWPDRAWLALLAGTLPIDRLAAMRLIVTPGTALRWHRGIVRHRRSRRGRSGCTVLVENSATTAGLGFHADCRYSLISPASLARRSTRAAGTGKAMTSGASSGARRPMPSPWWLRPVL